MKHSKFISQAVKASLHVLLAAGLLALSSCGDVTSKRPIGETPAHLDPQKWNGTWGTGDGHTLCACVKSADAGLLEVGFLDAKDNAVQFQKSTVHITQAAGWLWASYREDDSKPYTIVRISEPDDHLLAWTFQSPEIAQAVKSGALKGEILKDDKGRDGKGVLLDTLSDEQLQAIKAGKFGEVFDWGKPALVLTHIKD